MPHYCVVGAHRIKSRLCSSHSEHLRGGVWGVATMCVAPLCRRRPKAKTKARRARRAFGAAGGSSLFLEPATRRSLRLPYVGAACSVRPPAFLGSRRPNRGVRPPRCVVEGEHSAAGISGVLRSERDARPPRVFGPQMRERWCRWGGQGRSLIFDDRGAGLPPRLTGLGGTLRRLWRLLGCMLNFCFIMVTFIRRLSCEHLFCCCTVFVVC